MPASVRTDASGSTMSGEMAGMTRAAISSAKYVSIVATKKYVSINQSGSCIRAIAPMSALRPASRAGGNGSRSARKKADARIFFLVAGEMYSAILPRQMVVLVRMPGSSSVWHLAKYFNRSPLTIDADS